ncbi:hypothetical protein XI01_05085 [Bradyrhizobium sp. CCBAU 21360]|nr:hypothetical protein [Bradyrhizobium sp. CCBAU 21360]
MTAHRTLALRDALAQNPAIAFQAVLHNFVLTAFFGQASNPLDLTWQSFNDAQAIDGSLQALATSGCF